MQFCTVECLHFITGHIPGQMSLPAQLLSVASGVGYALIDARMGTCISCLGHYFLQMLLNEERLFNFIMCHIPQVNNIYIPYPNNCLLAIYKNFQWTQQVSINLSRWQDYLYSPIKLLFFSSMGWYGILLKSYNGEAFTASVIDGDHHQVTDSHSSIYWLLLQDKKHM